MATSPIVRLLRRVAEGHAIKQLTDLELLGRFSLEHDEEAFLGLMRRHGSMVLDVCRNVLGNESDAEDAFQATFLVLAQKAGAIRKPESVGSWLYGVAYRTAHKARADTARRQKCEARVPGQTPPRASDLTWAEAQQILHDELSRVSDYYRTPLVACYLEGKTQDQAAALLGVSKATVRNRLERGRTLLRQRLVRRGLGSVAVLATAAWPLAAASSQLRPVLVASTAKAAQLLSAGQTVAACLISARVAALTQEVLTTMFLTKLKTTTAALVIAGLLTGGLLLSGVLSADPSTTPHAALAQQATDQSQDEAPDKGTAKKGREKLKLRATLEGHSKAVQDVAFSPDGKLLASASADQTIKIWDTASGKEVKTLVGHPDVVIALAFSADGKSLASSTGGHFSTRGAGGPDAVKIWDVATWEEKVTLKDNDGSFERVAFSPDGKVLAAGFLRIVKLWDTATGKELATIKHDGSVGIYDTCLLAFSPDGKTLVMGTGAFGGVEAPIHLWNWSENKPNGALKTDGSCVFLAFTADGKTLVTLNSYGDLTLWDFEKLQERKTVKLKRSPPAGIAVSADGKVLALTYRLPVNKGKFNEAKGKVDLLDTATGELLETIPLDTAGQSVAFSAKGAMLAAGTRGKEQYPANLDTIRLGADAEGDLSGVVRVWNFRDQVIQPKK